jgi:hypothetical protein
MAFNKIILKNYSDVFVEYVAGSTIIPGQLLLLDSDGTVKAHDDDAPANCMPLFAIEDALQGREIDDVFAAGDPVRCWVPYRGDVVYAILEDGAKVVIGDFLESNGAGYLQKFTSGKVVGIALEAVDLSGSSGEETSVGVLGYNKRIQVLVA